MKRILFLLVLGIAALQFANAQPYSIMVVGESAIGYPSPNTVQINVGSLTDVVKVEVVAIAEMEAVPVDVEFSSGAETKTASFSSIDPTDENFSSFSQVAPDGPYAIPGVGDIYLGYYTATFAVGEIDASMEIQLDKMGQGNGILTFYAYVYRTGSAEVYSTLADAEKICYMFLNTAGDPAVYEFALDSDNPMDIQLLIPFSDNLDDDNRIGYVKYFEDDEQQGDAVPFSLWSGGTNFNIVSQMLNDVAPEITKIKLEIYSPNPSDPKGDSFFSGVPVMNVTEKPGEERGCTYTQGYWKTHSEYGPASKPDPTWELLPDGPDTKLYPPGGASWYEVFWTSPSGNPYYQLAHQYMAAKLNIMAGTSTPSEVNATILAEAESIIANGPLANITIEIKKNGKEKITIIDKVLANRMTELASIFADYNEGTIGPGHCDDEEEYEAFEKSAEIARIKDVNFAVYPNPVRGNAILSFNPAHDGYAVIDIYSSTGQKKGTLFSQRVRKDVPVSYTFDGNQFVEGLYIVRYQNGTGSQNLKIHIGR